MTTTDIPSLTPAPAMAQFPVECNDACAPTNTFYSSCGALPYEEGMACLGTLCVVSLPIRLLASRYT